MVSTYKISIIKILESSSFLLVQIGDEVKVNMPRLQGKFKIKELNPLEGWLKVATGRGDKMVKYENARVDVKLSQVKIFLEDLK